MPKPRAKKSAPKAAGATKGKVKKAPAIGGPPSMELDHDVTIPKGFPLKLKKKT